HVRAQRAAAAPPSGVLFRALRGGLERQVLHLDRGGGQAVRPEQDALVPRGAQGEPRRAGRGGGLMLRRNTRGAYLMIGLLAAAGAAGTAGCRGQTSSQPPIVPLRNMFDQDRYDAQEESEFFADGRTMRTPVAGTIPRERELDPQLAEGRLPDDS